MLLKGNNGKGRPRISEKPKKKSIKSGLRKSVYLGTYLGRDAVGDTRTRQRRESGISNAGELSGVINHFEISSLLLRRKEGMISQVHLAYTCKIYRHHLMFWCELPQFHARHCE